MKRILLGLFLFGLSGEVVAQNSICSSQGITQVSMVIALQQGVYDSNFSYADIMPCGDLGLGTFGNLDGEMVALDGKYYRMHADGAATLVASKDTVPFAQVINFHPTQSRSLEKVGSLLALNKMLESNSSHKNSPYAVRIDGYFDVVRFRNFPPQTKPYVTLDKVVKHQAILELQHVKGTMVGFWFPKYLGDMAVGTLHLHFITDDHKMGGHVLDLTVREAKLQLQPVNQVNVNLPSTKTFQDTDLNSAGLAERAEKTLMGN